MKSAGLYFLLAVCLLSSAPGLYAVAGTETGIEDDLTVKGADGDAVDPDAEIKGFTVFGATQTSYTGAVISSGSVVINGYLAVSSGAYFVLPSTFASSAYFLGGSTFTAGVYFTGLSSFTGQVSFSNVDNVQVGDGTANQVVIKEANGTLGWNNVSSMVSGDNLGSHISTMTLTANYGITASSGTFSGGVTASSFTASNTAGAGLMVSSSAYLAVLGGLVGIGTTTPSATLAVAGNIKATQQISGGCVNPDDPDDIMLPIGDLCVDKYEASVWSTATGGTQYGGAAQDYPCGNGVTGTGQTCTPAGTPIYARSVVGVTPSRWITWFQADIACGNSGKYLLSNAEWQAAAAGTPDDAVNCNISGGAPSVTGSNPGCVSGYGVENMVGSVAEWVADWGQYGQYYSTTAARGLKKVWVKTTAGYQELQTDWVDGTYTNTQWPDAGYGADGSWNVAGRSWNGSVNVNGLPAAVVRGGNWTNGAGTGVFAFNVSNGPSGVRLTIGFRCGRRR
jgi:hypothetical protein